MRSGTLVLLVAANAVIAVGIVAVALTVFPGEPESVETALADTRGNLEIAELQEDFTTLRDKIEVIETALEMRGKENAELRAELAKVEEKLSNASLGGGAPDANATPEERAAEAATREATRAMMRGMARGARGMGRRILESLANPTEESIRQAEERVRRDARRLGQRLNLPETRVAQVEQALLDVDRRTRDKMKATIDAKGIDNVTYDDAKPLIDESFKERETAMAGVLDQEELETFKQQDAQARAFVDMGMRMAFPSAQPAEPGGEDR